MLCMLRDKSPSHPMLSQPDAGIALSRPALLLRGCCSHDATLHMPQHPMMIPR